MKFNKKEWLEWVSYYLILFIGLAITLSVVHKLILKNDDWLYKCITWSVTYTIGCMLKPFLIEKHESSSRKAAKIISASLLLFIAIAFVIGVLWNMSAWLSKTIYIVFAFATALIISTGYKFKNEEDVKKDVETYYDDQDRISC